MFSEPSYVLQHRLVSELLTPLRVYTHDPFLYKCFFVLYTFVIYTQPRFDELLFVIVEILKDRRM